MYLCIQISDINFREAATFSLIHVSARYEQILSESGFASTLFPPNNLDLCVYF